MSDRKPGEFDDAEFGQRYYMAEVRGWQKLYGEADDAHMTWWLLFWAFSPFTCYGLYHTAVWLWHHLRIMII